MIICAANQIGKMYGANWVFQSLQLELQDSEKVSIVGRNGCGKTTLLKLLAGVESPDAGDIHWRQGTNPGYLAQIPIHGASLSTREVLQSAFHEIAEIESQMRKLETRMSTSEGAALEKLLNQYALLQEQFERKDGYSMEARIDEVAYGLGLTEHHLSSAYAALSGGEQTKVGLGVLLLQRPELLLLDEPTNHLDLAAIRWLESFLTAYKGTVVVVSHDRWFMDKVVTKVFDLDDGELSVYHGNYTSYVEQREARLLAEFEAYQEQQKKIEKMKEAIKRLHEWANRANPPNEGMHRRARSMQKALDKMIKLKRPTLNPKQMGLQFQATDRSGTDVVRLTRVKKGFLERTLFTGVDLHVRYGERIAIIGDNGAGKSTLLNLILNQLDPDDGEVRLGANVRVGYLNQHGLVGYDENLSVLDVFRDAAPVYEGEARGLLARFLFYGSSVFRRVKDLSGGERMRLRLAQLMYTDVNFLVLDEPTNHLDIASREVLEEALADFGGTILAVSHDRYFVRALFDRICWLTDGTLWTDVKWSDLDAFQ